MTGRGNRSYTSSRNYRGNNGNSNGQFAKCNREVVIEVPSQFIGKIIGKGGSKIKEIRNESGATILVTKDIVGENRKIKLIGEAHEIEHARRLIKNLTIERKPLENLAKVEAGCSTEIPKSEKYNALLEDAKTLDWKTMCQRHDRAQKEHLKSLPQINKCFYKEVDTVANMSTEQVKEFRQRSNNIIVSRVFVEKFGDKAINNPVRNFADAFHNYSLILDEIMKAGFEKPSPIQSQAWPVLLSGEDLIGIAQTGTGKTLAFLLPALIHIEGQKHMPKIKNAPRVLIMAPTRELALQIEREVKKYDYKGIRSVCVYGGGDKNEQLNSINEGIDICIATPGRLNDFVTAKKLLMEGITYVVLDEADKMLDMGFEPQIRRSLCNVRADRQTVMTSATWPEGVRRLATSYMINPVQIYVGSLDLAAVNTVAQMIKILPDDDDVKFEEFMNFAQAMDPEEKAIVFCGKKARADYLSSQLSLKGIYCASLHGDRDQSDREQALEDIKSGYVKILVATDLASRGIDIDDITYVVNYDFPRNIEEYVHRVGRTGRAGRSGQSITYFTRSDWSHADELIPILEKAKQVVPKELYQMKEKFAAHKKRKNDRPLGGNRGEFGRGGGGSRNGSGFGRRGGGNFFN